MDVKADDDFDNDEEEVEDDTDDEGAVDLCEVYRVMVVAEAVGMAVAVIVVVVCFVIVVVVCFVIVRVIVWVRGIHEGVVLSIVISCGSKGVDDLAVCVGIGGVGDKGRDGMGGAGGEKVFFSADNHFQFAVEDKGDLFVGVAMFDQPAAFFDLPDGEGAFVAVHHFPKKTRADLFGWDIRKIFHERFWGEGTEKRGDGRSALGSGVRRVVY